MLENIIGLYYDSVSALPGAGQVLVGTGVGGNSVWSNPPAASSGYTPLTSVSGSLTGSGTFGIASPVIGWSTTTALLVQISIVIDVLTTFAGTGYALLNFTDENSVVQQLLMMTFPTTATGQFQVTFNAYIKVASNVSVLVNGSAFSTATYKFAVQGAQIV